MVSRKYQMSGSQSQSMLSKSKRKDRQQASNRRRSKTTPQPNQQQPLQEIPNNNSLLTEKTDSLSMESSKRSSQSQKNKLKLTTASNTHTTSKVLAGTCMDFSLVCADVMEALLSLLETVPLQHNNQGCIPIREIQVPCCLAIVDESDQVSCLENPECTTTEKQALREKLQLERREEQWSRQHTPETRGGYKEIVFKATNSMDTGCNKVSDLEDQGFDDQFRIQWSVHRNVLPGLDKWDGTLRLAKQSYEETESSIMGLVEGFWIRKDWKCNIDTVNDLNEALGRFLHTTRSRGWPQLQQDTTEQECCLITHVWIDPMCRGGSYGLALVEEARRIIPQRFHSDTLMRSQRNQFSVHVVLAVPPCNSKLKAYFARSDWSKNWAVHFLVKTNRSNVEHGDASES